MFTVLAERPSVTGEGSGGVFELTSSGADSQSHAPDKYAFFCKIVVLDIYLCVNFCFLFSCIYSGHMTKGKHGKHGHGHDKQGGHGTTHSNSSVGSGSPPNSSRGPERPSTAEREAGIGTDAAMPESVWRETMEHLTTAEHVFSRMLEIAAQPGQSPEGMTGSQSMVTTGHGGQMGGTFIGSTFDGYAASFNAKEGYVDFSLRDARNLPQDLWTDQNADGGFIQNNIRVVSKKNLRAHEHMVMSQPESVYASALGGTAAGTTNAIVPTYNDTMDVDSQNSNDSSIDLIDKTRPATPGTMEANGMAATDGSLLPAGHLATQPVIDGDLMTRHGVKTMSVSLTTDHNRQVQQELRQQKLLERMKIGTGPGQESALDKAARVKAQEDSAVRLCVFRHPPTLPQGSTLRDLPLEKTEAFLTKMPKLT